MLYIVITSILVIEGKWYDARKIKKSIKVKLLLFLLVVYLLGLFKVISVLTVVILFSIMFLVLTLIDLIYFDKIG